MTTELTPQQQAALQTLQQGQTYDLEYPGLQDVQVHIQHFNTWLSYKNIDGLHHYQMKGFAGLSKSSIDVTFNSRIRRHSNGELLNADTFTYHEKDFWPFALATPAQTVELFGYQQAINGLLRRLPDFGGNPKQYGPSLFSFTGDTIALIAFEVATTPETVDAEGNGQADGQIEITVTHGDAPFEYSLDGATWQDSNVFDQLAASEYFVMVRSKAGVPIGAPKRYRTVTVGTAETPAQA